MHSRIDELREKLDRDPFETIPNGSCHAQALTEGVNQSVTKSSSKKTYEHVIEMMRNAMKKHKDKLTPEMSEEDKTRYDELLINNYGTSTMKVEHWGRTEHNIAASITLKVPIYVIMDDEGNDEKVTITSYKPEVIKWSHNYLYLYTHIVSHSLISEPFILHYILLHHYVYIYIFI
jgi:hypothetical protein